MSLKRKWEDTNPQDQPQPQEQKERRQDHKMKVALHVSYLGKGISFLFIV